MFLEQIRHRRSIRKFQPHPVEPEKVEKLIEAALRSPSSRSICPWQFILVDQREILDKLATAKPHGGAFLKNAPLGIIVCADTTASDVWVEDTSIASIFIQLAAQELGLGSCWVQIRKREHNAQQKASEHIKNLLNIPEHIEVESIMALGYPAEEKAGHAKEDLPTDKVFFNGYGHIK